MAKMGCAIPADSRNSDSSNSISHVGIVMNKINKPIDFFLAVVFIVGVLGFVVYIASIVVDPGYPEAYEQPAPWEAH